MSRVLGAIGTRTPGKGVTRSGHRVPLRPLAPSGRGLQAARVIRSGRNANPISPGRIRQALKAEQVWAPRSSQAWVQGARSSPSASPTFPGRTHRVPRASPVQEVQPPLAWARAARSGQNASLISPGQRHPLRARQPEALRSVRGVDRKCFLLRGPPRPRSREPAFCGFAPANPERHRSKGRPVPMASERPAIRVDRMGEASRAAPPPAGRSPFPNRPGAIGRANRALLQGKPQRGRRQQV